MYWSNTILNYFSALSLLIILLTEFMIYVSCAQDYKNNHHDQSSSNDNKCHSPGQSSIPFSTFPTEGKLRDKVFDIGFLFFCKLPNFVIEVNWLIIALIDSCDWGWLGKKLEHVSTWLCDNRFYSAIVSLQVNLQACRSHLSQQMVGGPCTEWWPPHHHKYLPLVIVARGS